MKILVPILALLILPACHSSAFKSNSVPAKANSTMSSYNAGNSLSAPNDVSMSEQSKQGKSESKNERFKIAPEDFKQIDFKNYSYKFSYGRKVNIVLKNGEYEYNFADDRGWFNLSGVYYVDLTNDGNPEAIVILSHV